MFRDRDGFRVQWRDKGRRRSRKFKTEKEAKLFELQMEMGVADITPSARLAPTFAEYAKRWLKEYCQVEKSETQWAKDELCIRLHLDPAFGGVRLSNLRKTHLLDLKSKLRDKKAHGKTRPLTKKSINNILALAKKIVATAVDQELIPANPFIGVKPYKLGDREFKFWAPEERDRFIETAYPLDRDFVRLVAVACHTGLRLGELAALTRADLDFDRGMIRVRASWSVELQKRLSTKGKEIADVPMNPVVKEALEPVLGLKPQADVFSKDLFWSARKRLGRLAKMVGVEPIRFHDLRHTFASCSAMAGMDLMMIQKLLRHKSYQMTLRYAHLHPSHLKGATDILCRHANGTQDNPDTKKAWAQRDLNPQPIGYEPETA